MDYIKHLFLSRFKTIAHQETWLFTILFGMFLSFGF